MVRISNRAGNYLKKIMFFCVILLGTLAGKTSYAAGAQMRLHALYLTDGADEYSGNEVHGEAVLMESNGEYLLMDIGEANSYESLKSYLYSAGVTKASNLSVYISHWHKDHSGGMAKQQGFQKIMQDFSINKVYLPDASIYSGINMRGNYDKARKYYNMGYQGADADKSFVYLKMGSSFQLGSVTANVIGPVNPAAYSLNYKDTYINNCSLVTKFTSGNITYLTSGDMETESEEQLINTWGNALKSTIYKIAHHGLAPTNSKRFLSYVQPEFSFETNMEYTENIIYGSKGQMHRKTYSSYNNCRRYGMVYLIADERRSCILDISGGQVKLSRRGESQPVNSPGWCRLAGGDGVYDQYGYYYCDASGKPLTGVQNISGNLYYLGIGGCRETGYYFSSNGQNTYKGFQTHLMPDGSSVKRYYQERTDIMLTGYQKIGSKYYYFREDGTLVTGDTNGSVQKINDAYYAVYSSGSLSTGTWRKYPQGLSYFGADSRRVTGWIDVNKKRYYIDPSTGYRVTGMKKIGKNKYYFSKEGILYRQTCVSDGRGTYYANTSGVIKTGWIKLNGARFYFDPETSYMSYGFTQIKEKVYYFEKNGARATNKKVKVKGKKYKADKRGVISEIKPTMKSPIRKVKARHKKAVVSWQKSDNASGYRIYTAESKNGDYKLVKTVKGKSQTSYTVKGLKKGKTYYFKVAAYRKFAGTRLYAEAGKAQKVKVK